MAFALAGSVAGAVRRGLLDVPGFFVQKLIEAQKAFEHTSS